MGCEIIDIFVRIIVVIIGADDTSNIGTALAVSIPSSTGYLTVSMIIVTVIINMHRFQDTTILSRLTFIHSLVLMLGLTRAPTPTRGPRTCILSNVKTGLRLRYRHLSLFAIRDVVRLRDGACGSGVAVFALADSQCCQGHTLQPLMLQQSSGCCPQLRVLRCIQ